MDNFDQQLVDAQGLILAMARRWKVRDPEDTLMAVNVKMMQLKSRYVEDGHFRTLALCILVNTAKTEYRHTKRMVDWGDSFTDGLVDGDDPFEKVALAQTLEAMPRLLRAVSIAPVVDRAFGYSFAECGERSGVSEATAKSRHHRAILVLERHIL